VAFACGVAAEATIAGDRAARESLGRLDPAQRAVTLTQQGPASGAVDRHARALLAGLGLPAPTRTVLLNPVRLSGRVVRLAAIEPLSAWAGRPPGRCRARACPVLFAGGTVGPRTLRAPGARIAIAGAGHLRSAAALGFLPTAHGQPLLLTGDVTGLAALPALSSVYRVGSWLSVPRLTGLHSWELASFERRLTRVQAGLAPTQKLSLSAPIDALQSARDEAAAAPRRLLVAGGGALAVLAMFLILAAYGLRRDQQAERDRLRAAGARTRQLVAFSLAEAAWLAGVAMLAGAAVGVAVAALLAAQAGLPAGAVLSHSLLTAPGAAALAGGWVVAVALIGTVLLAAGGRVADALAVAAAAALALALTVGGGGDDTLALLAAPLACLAGAGLVYRVAGVLLRGGERVTRGGPPVIRLAFVGLARSPVAPALAVAFVAVSTGLAGFAIGYRATLRRGAADQAAQQVGLDARIGPSASFARPLDVATPSRWRALAGPRSRVLAVRRTDGALPLSGNTITLPVLGVPASGLTAIRDWRAGDGSAPVATLARRLAPHRPTRTPGPRLPAGVAQLTVRAQAPDGEVRLSADLRGADGGVTQVALGTVSARPRFARARVPTRGGPYELEAFEVGEPTGVEAVNGHQNAENPAAATQSTTTVRLSRVFAGGRSLVADWHAWRAVGAVRLVATRAAGVTLSYDDSGQPGVLRPRQPSDARPVPVLTDRATAAGVGRDGELPVTVDGEPVTARVVGTLRRFPTIAAGGGFVIADEATLDGALEASLPGQGRTDELWISTARPERLRAALRRPPLDALSVSFRADVQSSLAGDPIARGILGTLLVAAATSAVLAILGLLAALLGAMRDVRSERDLIVLGLSPRELRHEQRARVLVAGTLGTVAGLILAVVLTRLVVGAVHASGTVAAPDPPLMAIAPWGELGLLALAAIVAFALVGAVATWLSADER
jgi:hypothetical protein